MHRTRPWPSSLLVCVLVLLAATSTSAQPANRTAPTAPAASAPPLDVFTKDADGKVTIRATRIGKPIKIDGKLDDAAYNEVSPITEWVQQEPKAGAPITEKTEAWVLFDDDNIYVSCRCWDSHPERIVANDMRRDSGNLSQHDNFGVTFDTFHDERNGFLLYVTAIGAMRDAAVTDTRLNADWNPVWDEKVSRFEQGWVAETAIPFKSLRYGSGRQQTWGIQMRRSMRSKNEVALLTPVNPQWGVGAVHRMEAAATLVGIEVPPPARNLEIKPYAISRLTTDLVRRPAVRNDLDADAGIDVKYGVTPSLTADFTYNTDFAKVEVDEAQVNLTRFSLSFPEKREFFVEGQGTFQFGGGGSASGGGPGFGGGGGGGGGEGAGGDAPTIFYSRRIGLNGSRIIPVVAGGRLTGKTGPWSIGALSITTDDDAASNTRQTNFSVMRVRRDVLQKSAVGAMFARRSMSAAAPGDNRLWGLDAGFLFGQNVSVGGYVAQTQTSGRSGDDFSYRGQFNYGSDRYGFGFDRLVVEKNFNPEIGFLRRENFRRNYTQARFSPRPRNHPYIRRFNYQTSFEYTTDNHNRLETRELHGEYGINFHNGDALSVSHSRLYEFIPTPFTIHRGVTIPIGGYSFHNTRMSFTAGQQHKISGSGTFEIGRFYEGDKRTTTFRGRIEITPQLSVEPNLSLNWIDLPQGSFTDKVVGGRGTFSLTPRSFVAALVQYSSSTTSLSTNLRLRWEYQPGSELFVVYSEGRSTLPTRGVPIENRGFVVKVNRLFRF